jgi:hypothetical protein
MHHLKRNRYVREAEDEDDIVIVDDEDADEEEIEGEIEEVEEETIVDKLSKIGDDLGYDFIGGVTSGSFSLSNSVEVFVRYSDDKIQKLEVRLLKSNPRFNCMRNTTEVDNISVELQTATLIVKSVKQKLM